MMPLPRLPFSFPPRGAVLVVFCALYILPGLTGHDPWKGDDLTHFGVAYSFLDGGSWLLPHLAGETWLDSPPLYHWVAAGLAKCFGFALPLHDAARLASGLFAGIMVASLVGAARCLIGREAGRGAALVAIGCLGLLVHIHEGQPAMAFLAATALSYYGLALLSQQPLRGGLIAGAALGLGFLAAGLPALIALGPTLILLPLLSPQLRTARGMAAALSVATALVLSWPLTLHFLEPTAFVEWWSRELADLRKTPDFFHSLWNFAKLLSWFAWPALPLAAWTLWKERRRLGDPKILIPLVSFLVLLSVQSFFSDPRSLNALPLLPPLVLLAAPATLSLRRGATNAFDWFGMMTFTLLAGLIWLGWVAMVTGTPRRIANNFARMEPGFVAHFSSPPFAAALALTLAWLWLIFASPRSPQRSTVHWAAGVTLSWGLMMALWMPWIDHGRSYRSVAMSLKASLPPGHGCIRRLGLSDAQRAALDYFANIRTLPESYRKSASCNLVLTQGSAQRETFPPGSGWRKIWEGQRPGERNERFRLYTKP